MAGKPRRALHSFQFRHVSGLVKVAQGDVVPYGHPAVEHRPGWFEIADAETPVSDVVPDEGQDTPDGEE